MPEGLNVVVVVLAMVPAAVCIGSGAAHLTDPDPLGSALRQLPLVRRYMPYQVTRPAARTWGIVELTTGVVAIAVVLGPVSSTAKSLILGWLTLVYAGFVAWITLLRNKVDHATCGCGRRLEPADNAALVRALILGSCASAATLVFALSAIPQRGSTAWMALPMAIVLARIVWLLPTATRPIGAGS